MRPIHPAFVRSGGAAARLIAVLGCTAMLAGCYTTDYDHAPIPIDLRQRHPITINEGEHTAELFIGSRRGGLNASQRAEVIAFAHEWQRKATGGIVVNLPAHTNNQVAAADSLPEIRSLLAAGGVPPQDIAVRKYRPESPAELATVRLSYPTMVATAGPCGLWPHDLGPTFDREHEENLEYWNFGCASQRNLAAMVDNPADLVQPRSEAPIYAPRRATVVDKYRQGQPTQTQNPDAEKGKISDVGK
jgi:pilus assembly protein CpaD